MAAATSNPSVPTYPYDIHPNDFLRIFNQNYPFPVNGTFGMGPGESFYIPSLNEAQAPTFPYFLPSQHPNNLCHIKSSQAGLAPTFPTDRVTYNGGLPPTFQSYNAVPHLQIQPSFTTSLSRTSGSSTSLLSASTPSPASLLREKVHKANSKSKEKGKRATRNAAQSAKSELLTGNQKRKRGPNKRPPGTSFSELLVRSSRIFPANEKHLLNCRGISGWAPA